MPVILALDSSTEACSCALAIEGEIFEKFEIMPRLHTQYILPMIKDLMAEHNLSFTALDSIAVGAGPGSFTGIRIAAGVAQGIAFGANLPLIPVSTLAAMAQQNLDSGSANIFSCLDARINEVYWAVYSVQSNKIRLEGSEQLCKPELVELKINGSCFGVGSGMNFIDQMSLEVQSLIQSYDSSIYPRAGAIAELATDYFVEGMAINPADFSPTYLRNKVTQN